ncbi:MAG: pirin family protein, partial [Phycisphaerales bacterium]
MLTIRRSNDRGHAAHGWLDSRHTFSFGSYHDPAHMGFRVLRVMNEDRVAPSQGFDTHGHRDMEIVTYVLEGSLRHRDSLGTTETLKAGELQRMSAGTGILHSEFNDSSVEPVHFYQLWIRPRTPDAPPSYEQRAFAREGRANRL